MLYFKKRRISSVDEILDKYSANEFKSPYRSTIPLIVLFKQDKSLLIDLIAEKTTSNTYFIFEFETPVKKGNGRASCTDLMIDGDNFCIAIEVKRTEPKYPTVEKWLDGTKNKEDVLNGWLEFIFMQTKVQLRIDQILAYPYQMIHRVASACSLQKKETTLLYVGFDLTDSMKNYYITQLEVLSNLLEKKIQMKLICIDIKKTKFQKELEKSWDDGVRNLSKQVKDGICNSRLMSFVK